MNKLLTGIFLTVAMTLAASAQVIDIDAAGSGGAKPAKVTASLVAEVKAAAPGRPFRIAVKLVHAPHNHTYGKKLPADGTGVTTTLAWELPDGWKAEELPWPEPHEVPSTGGEKSLGYDETVYLPAKITPAGAAGTAAEIVVKVRGLVCDPESCMPFKTEAKTSLPLAAAAEIAAASTEVFQKVDAGSKTAGDSSEKDATAQAAKPKHTADEGVLTLVIFAFLGGLILNVMPCVFPVLGIKVLGIVRQSGEDRTQVVRHGFVYTAGVLVCFWILAGLVIALGKGWGFQLQNAGFVFGLTCFFVVFAMNMAGVFEIGSSAVGVGAELQSRQGLGGSFFSGLLAVVVATPCSAPFLAPALTYALSLPAALALLMFTVIGLGLASPFLLLSFAPGLVSKLPRPGVWMESFKQGMSFLLFGTAGYMIAILAKLISAERLVSSLLGVTIIAFSAWMYGRWCLPHKPAATRFRAMVIVILTFGLGIWHGWPRAEFEWEKWSPELVKKLRDAGEPVYVDFTAIWCATCQVNHRLYDKEEIQKAFLSRKVHLLKADWSKPDAQIQKALDELGESAIPVNLLYVPGKKEPIVLPKLLTVENLTGALNTLPK
ncbi:MAG: thioredoxin family protein [Verrucomicrobiaceae bacterium]|nr:thioredoxin family protein [Verrucomicrobiaceae bacterium]